MQQHACCTNKYIDSSSETVFNYIFEVAIAYHMIKFALCSLLKLLCKNKRKSDASLSVKVLGTLKVKPHY